MNPRRLLILPSLVFCAWQARGDCKADLPSSPPSNWVTACGQSAYVNFPVYPNCWAVNPFTHALYAGPEQPNIHTEVEARALRATLINALWGNDGFPRRSDLNVDRDVHGCLHLSSSNPEGNDHFCYPFGNLESADENTWRYGRPANLQQVDRLTILTPLRSGDFDPGTGAQTSISAPNTICDFRATYTTAAGTRPAATSVAYFYHPTVSNGRLAVFVHGHEHYMANDGGKEVIDTMLAQGFSVLAFWMPLLGENERCHAIPVYRPPNGCSVLPDHVDPDCQNVTYHTQFTHVGVEQGNALKVFLEPIAVALNYAIQNASAFKLATPVEITMFGISGGGWTTTAYAALDPRVRVSFPTAGSLPKSVIANISFHAPQDPNNPADPLEGVGDFEIDFREQSEIGKWADGSSKAPWAPNVIYRSANTSDLYMLGAVGDRRKAIQVLNQFDDCCYWGVGYQSYMPGLRNLTADRAAFPAGGLFQVYSNQNNDVTNSMAVPPVFAHRIAPVVARSVAYQELFDAIVLPKVDFDGDGIADPAIFRPPDPGSNSAATWSYLSHGTVTPLTGITGMLAGDQPVPADYFGDGHTDVAVYRPATGAWYIRRSSNQTQTAITTGLPGGTAMAGDIPLPADYDGDNKADIAVFRPSNGTWYIRRSTDNSVISLSPADAPWGAFRTGDVPLPARYNNNPPNAQLALFRPTSSTWYVVNWWTTAGSAIKPQTTSNVSSWTVSLLAPALAVPAAGDIPVPADYDGDGSADMAFFRPTEPRCVGGVWYIRYSTNPSTLARVVSAAEWTAGDRPIPGPYLTAGTAEPVLFRPSNGHWYPQDGRDLQIGASKLGDVPLGSRTNWSYRANSVTYASLYPPTDVNATASGLSMTITWKASPSWPLSPSAQYQVFRKGPSASDDWTRINAQSTITALSTTDTVPASGTYLYKVKALVGSTLTDDSTIDLATTITFTDDETLRNQRLKTAHVTEMYTAVNMVLSVAGLPVLPVPDFQTEKKPLAAEVQTLRDGVVRAYTAIGMALPPPYDSGSVVADNKTRTMADHFQEIRNAVK